ncbi:hypothetical protein [uncultured Desulfovibrio sp.]|uniref:hypothetical protein n=1 Tax=uncultured Desulfovibrio sp. TaxID=167968 RepID=UPI00261BCE27|nr:hypothetical protein [uncultured Desulfovibrio sp.]
MHQLPYHLETVSDVLDALARGHAAERPLLALAACHLRLLASLAMSGNALPQPPACAAVPSAAGTPRPAWEAGHVVQ